MEEKLVEVSEQEVLIDFALGIKCRTNIKLQSILPTIPVAFKVQTSSPHKFLVNPPNGLIPPLCSASVQIILKPQTNIPITFPRSSIDRFLIKTSAIESDSDSTNNNPSPPTHFPRYQDIKLKVFYVGSFLLRHSISNDDLNAVKQILKKQSKMGSQVHENGDARCLVEAAAASRSVEMLSFLCNFKMFQPLRKELMEMLESWNLALTAARRGDVKDLQVVLTKGLGVNCGDQYRVTALHAAAIKGHANAVAMLLEFGLDLESRDGEGHTALHYAVEGGHRQIVEILIERGANVNARSDRGATPLYTAAAMGYDHIAKLLAERGACASDLPSSSSSSSS